jgi:hypothetical protein
MQRLIDLFFDVPAAWALGAVVFLTCAEASLFFGFVIPGEIAVVLGGVLASRGTVKLESAVAAAVGGNRAEAPRPALQRRAVGHWKGVTQERRPGSPGTAYLQSVRPICAKGTAYAKDPADD